MRTILYFTCIQALVAAYPSVAHEKTHAPDPVQHNAPLTYLPKDFPLDDEYIYVHFPTLTLSCIQYQERIPADASLTKPCL